MDKFDKAIGELERADRFISHNPTDYGDSWLDTSNAIDLAITVLKQQQEREQGCDYCTRGKDIQIKFEGEEAGRAWIHNCSDGYGLFLEGEVITYIDVKYCPMCGRKLVQE